MKAETFSDIANLINSDVFIFIKLTRQENNVITRTP